EPCGIEGKEDLALALQLVRRGYVCIVPDMLGFGERIPPGEQPYADSIKFYRKHPKWSFMGKMIWDISRVIDYLEQLPYVDPLQIGCIGHSHGAYTTLFATAFEPRISLAIASCGFTTFRDDPQIERWSHLTALIPQLGIYLPKVDQIPFDWHHICSLIAPRPMFVWYGLHDDIFPNTDKLDTLFQDLRTVYGLYGAADDLVWHAFDGPHSFPDIGRETAYRWLERRLFPTGHIHDVPDRLAEWKKRRQLIRRVIRRTIGTPKFEPPPFNMKLISAKRFPKYERRLIEYLVGKDDRVKAYLCIPEIDRVFFPAVLVLHGTTPEGKIAAMGINGDKSRAFAADLAERGYITLAPDSITAGERIDKFGAFDTRGHYLKHPDLSAMGKMLFDAQRALDVLIEIDGVDKARIGAIGHSLGAEEVLMLAAFDERVKATVASCGYATFKAEKNRLRWARDHWFSYMPKLRHVFQQGRIPHWDWDDVLRLIAPRSLYQHTTRNDEIFTESQSAYHAGENARAIWKLYGRSEQLVNMLKPGKHEISDKTKIEIYDWLDNQLNNHK
ncbi:MAG: alpha/beta hydrolase family protein, partial [Planctomycetota bacterium]